MCLRGYHTVSNEIFGIWFEMCCIKPPQKFKIFRIKKYSETERHTSYQREFSQRYSYHQMTINPRVIEMHMMVSKCLPIYMGETRHQRATKPSSNYSSGRICFRNTCTCTHTHTHRDTHRATVQTKENNVAKLK